MAQEVRAVMPQAVACDRDVYLEVFYDKLGLTFRPTTTGRIRRACPGAQRDRALAASGRATNGAARLPPTEEGTWLRAERNASPCRQSSPWAARAGSAGVGALPAGRSRQNAATPASA